MEKVIEITKGSTAVDLLKEIGVPGGEAYDAIEALSTYYDSRRFRAGQELTITMEENQIPVLKKIEFQHSFDEKLTVIYNGYNFEANIEKLEFKLAYRAASGIIDSNPYLAMKKADMPDSVIMEIFRCFASAVDFSRDIREGDSFKVLYEMYTDDDGEDVKGGPVVFVELMLSGKPMQLYGFVNNAGFYDYYDNDGKSVRKALIKTPIDNYIITSRFGMREDPILGYNKSHTGIDFAAPKNTPIVAAGNGVVEKASWNGGYGNCIIIRHTNGYKTLYGHLNDYARGITPGARVTQGQVIGYVGTTGHSTGYHLHYEVIINGKKVNPATVKSPPEKNLTEKELLRFFTRRDEIIKEFQHLQTTD
ncbi:MAG: M23 family metallopeptidase [Spirochaetia bacterium]|nr:M23 family metallopeptidase [Spirochaetia bacterium]